jgi:hypothetical protein
MAIRISSQIAPLNDAQAIYTHEDIFGKGGFVAINTQGISGSTASERIDNIITPARRKIGMLVYDVHTNFYYRREESSWTQEDFGGGTGGGASTLGALTDVDLTSGVSVGNLIRFNGTSWIPFDVDSEFVKFTDLPQTTDGSLDIAQESTLEQLINSLDSNFVRFIDLPQTTDGLLDIAQESSLNDLIDLVNSLDLSGAIKEIEAGLGIVVEKVTDDNFKVSVDSTVVVLDEEQSLTNKTINGLLISTDTESVPPQIAFVSSDVYGISFQPSGNAAFTQISLPEFFEVVVNDPIEGESLVWDGTKWINSMVSGSLGGTDGGGASVFSKFVTWGSDPGLSNERVLLGSENIIVDVDSTNIVVSLNTNSSYWSSFVRFEDLPQTTDGILDIAQQSSLNDLIDLVNSLDLPGSVDTNGILVTSLSELEDVLITNPSQNNIIIYNETNNKWENLDLFDAIKVYFNTDTEGNLDIATQSSLNNLSSLVNELALCCSGKDCGDFLGTDDACLLQICPLATSESSGYLYWDGDDWSLDLPTDTTYTNGNGLSLSGTTFSVNNGKGLTFDQDNKLIVDIVTGSGLDFSGNGLINNDRGSSQNIFKTIAVQDQTGNVVAGSNTDTLTFVAGTNVTILPNATQKTITISASISGSVANINDLGDVTISDPVNGNILIYENSIWKNTNTIYGGASGTFT